MNIPLWIVQALLAIMFGIAGATVALLNKEPSHV